MSAVCLHVGHGDWVLWRWSGRIVCMWDAVTMYYGANQGGLFACGDCTMAPIRVVCLHVGHGVWVLWLRSGQIVCMWNAMSMYYGTSQGGLFACGT